MHATQPVAQGLAFLPHVKLITNPHARLPLPSGSQTQLMPFGITSAR
jgi:hypothetical protein